MGVWRKHQSQLFGLNSFPGWLFKDIGGFCGLLLWTFYFRVLRRRHVLEKLVRKSSEFAFSSKQTGIRIGAHRTISTQHLDLEMTAYIYTGWQGFIRASKMSAFRSHKHSHAVTLRLTVKLLIQAAPGFC